MQKTIVPILLLALLAMGPGCKHHREGSSAGFELRVDAGNSASYKDLNGKIWEQDREYGREGYGFVRSYGDKVDRGWSAKIAGTDEPRIYQTEHWGVERFAAEVPDGRYRVILHFAETWDGIDKEGPRVFDIKIENSEVLKGFDILKEAGAMHTAVTKEFRDIEVDDGKLDIRFIPRHQNPLINGIEIIGEPVTADR
ncbi:MAG: hypothetical protein EHM61_05500 [Acidobacteria bacterium]|nr:MAG: hypothetical protein EHM61_05500 [Acidobacteriota bacterium]